MLLSRTCVIASLVLVSTCSSVFSDTKTVPQTFMTKPGKVLFQDTLTEQPDKKDWRYGPGDWKIEKGVLQGSERAADMHGAVLRHAMKFRDAILCYEFQLNGAKTTTLSINDSKEHVCRVLLRPNGFTARKDDHDHKGPDVAVDFETKPVVISLGEWHTLVVEFKGAEMVVTLDGQHTAFGGDELLNCEKANFGFTVSGESASFRNVRVWEALPNSAWDVTKEKLQAARAKPAPSK